jgi:hypothetical protein
VAELGLHAVEFCCNHNYDSMEVAGHVEEIKARRTASSCSV